MQNIAIKSKIFFFQLTTILLVCSSINLVNSDLIFFKANNNYSIILMIGDGMGFEHVKIARYIEVGKNYNLTMESLNLNLSVMTHNALFGITDSAASATALATGVKTYNRRIAIGPDGSNLETILEIAQKLNKSTGIITSAFLQHATPASFMSHVSSRSSYDEITQQIVGEANVDILLGGGLEYFSFQQLEEMQNNGYSIIENKTALEMITTGKILGLFSEGYMSYEQDRNLSLIPSLSEMTQKAIEVLELNTNGFFLMIEGGRIDHGSHDNDKVNAILETIAFDLAVKEALNYVKNHDNSILIVTADHETGGLAFISDNLDNNLPSIINTEEENRTLRISRINQVDVSWSTGGHTLRNVPFYAYGKAFDNISDVSLIDNTDIFKVMNNFVHGEDLILIDRSPVNIIPTRIIIPLVIISYIVIIIVIISNITSKKRKEKLIQTI